MSLLSIHLPEGFSSKVKQGDKVALGQLVAFKNIAGRDYEVDLKFILNSPASQVFRYLLKRPGDRVEEGTIVAFKKGTLGIGSKKAVSPVGGTVFKFDQESSVLTIRSLEESKTRDLFSPVDGIVAVCDNEKITIKTQRDVILARDVSGGGNLEAVLYVIKGEEINIPDIKADVKGKIITGEVFDREALSKSLGLGVLGIIAERIREEDLKDLKTRMIKTPIFIVEKKDLKNLLKADGKKVYIETEKKTIIIL